MSIELPSLPTSDEIKEELTALKARTAELRALLRVVETCELVGLVNQCAPQRQGNGCTQHATE